VFVFLFVSFVGAADVAFAGEFKPNPNAGPGDVVVRGKLGGLIFGLEIDPNGAEGLLCEAVLNDDGTVSARVETFNQATGRIIGSWVGPNPRMTSSRWMSRDRSG
jgi:hypothetical protein